MPSKFKLFTHRPILQVHIGLGVTLFSSDSIESLDFSIGDSVPSQLIALLQPARIFE
ncbi:hypothetical protein D3C85_1927960 [compost metagenome]